ncbi:hypothetical protein ABZW30_16620 [Kitasatospora sp. NPDC004669]|uniref:hypothetical protein n=1 Tax=Kitasatospora sp. NPDC004669 TaxID=3154555 RepID=UPI0033AE3591
MGEKRGPVRVLGAGIMVALVVAGAAACEGGGRSADAAAAASSAASTPPEPFGMGGYRGLKLSMTKDEALASGALEAAPVSLLNGCTDFAYKGGPAPDPVRMAAEADARAKSDKVTAKLDEIKAKTKTRETLPPGASLKQMQEYNSHEAERLKEQAADMKELSELSKDAEALTTARKNRDLAFLATGRVGFGTEGLRELVAPAGARTADGIGAGSTEDELKQAYDAKGLKSAKDGTYELEAEGGHGGQGWFYEFTMDGGKVSGLALVKHGTYCS